MADQWSYRMFGQEFGPVPFAELKELADSGAISSTDEVRAGESADWVIAGSVHELGLANDVVADSVVATTTLDRPEPDRSTGADNWYCMFHGQELGPLGIEEIEAFAEQGQLAADDEVKLGANGKWRRVGSIGRLMAVLPYSAAEKQIPAGKRSETTESSPTESPRAVAAVESVTQGAPPVSVAPQVAPAINAELIHAQAAYAAADHAAKVLVGWATAPTADPAWWGWVGGTEYGPVGFLQIFEWAVSGHLQSADFVKNGVYGQYLPAASVPGLMAAATMLKQAKETLKAEEAKAAAARTPTVVPPAPAMPIAMAPKVESPKPAAVIQTPEPVVKPPAPKSAVEPAPVTKPTAEEAPARPAISEAPAPRSIEPERPAATPVRPSGGYNTMASGGSYNSMASAARPAPARPKAPTRSSGSSSSVSISELLASPAGKGGLGAAVAILLFLGWSFMPASKAKDIERYKNLKQILDDVREARNKKSDPSAIKPRAEKLTKEYTPILKVEASNEFPAKQSLLWAARDELPRMMAGNLMEESQAEKAFAAHLTDAANKLGIK